MGVQRPGAETQAVACPGSSAGPGQPEGGPSARRRWTAVAAYLLSGAVLFTAYLRLSATSPLNSDSANILLMGQDLLRGNLLLHGWYMSDVSFYPTEIPQYALLESFLGLHMQTAHVAAAMTYTLAFLLAVLLARTGSAGRAAWTRTLIAAGVMLAPQLGPGVFALDLSVGHIGTAVPLLLVWLLLDRAPPRWYVPVLAAVLLAWVLTADRIVYVVAIGPLGLVCAVRAVRGWAAGTGPVARRIAGQWYDLALAASAAAATGLAWSAGWVLRGLGGFAVNGLPFYFVRPDHLSRNVPALQKVLQVFGADYAGLGGVRLVLAFLHLASVLVVALALLLAARRFLGQISLVDQVLTVAIVANVALFLLTNAADLTATEVTIVVPSGAVLAARMLVRGVRADGETGAGARRSLTGRAGLAAVAVGVVVLAGYTAGFGYELAQPSASPANARLASWLAAHDLTRGLSGYWSSSSVTVDSGNRVQVRALMQYSLKRDLWMAKLDWYDPKRYYANFIVLDSQPGYYSHWEPRALIRKYFGRPALIYQTGPYTVMVWNKNLLESIPR